MLARYFMYSQVYFHPVRRIYDIHLMDFLTEWLDENKFSVDLPTHLSMTDNEVTAGLLESAFNEDKVGHMHAHRIIERKHFKLVYERNPKDVAINLEAGRAIFKALCAKYDSGSFRHDRYLQRSGSPDFPVRLRDDQIVSSLALSETLNNVPVVSVDYVFSERSLQAEANEWLREMRDRIIQPNEEEEDNE